MGSTYVNVPHLHVTIRGDRFIGKVLVNLQGRVKYFIDLQWSLS